MIAAGSWGESHVVVKRSLDDGRKGLFGIFKQKQKRVFECIEEAYLTNTLGSLLLCLTHE